MYSNYHAFHIIVQSLFHSQRTCNIEKAVLVSGANYTFESQRVFIWKWRVFVKDTFNNFKSRTRWDVFEWISLYTFVREIQIIFCTRGT